MNPLKSIREDFAPYEIAAGAVLVQYVLIVAAVALALLAGRTAAIIAALLAVAAAWFASFGVRCPRCGKSVLRYYMTAWGEEQDGEPMGNRVWPERRCSSCGTALDIL